MFTLNTNSGKGIIVFTTISFIFILILSTYFISAGYGIDNSNLPRVKVDTQGINYINNSYVTVNNNYYNVTEVNNITTNISVNTTQMSLVDNFLNILPSWLTSLFYTKSEIDSNNASWSSTYNITYDSLTKIFNYTVGSNFTICQNITIAGNFTYNITDRGLKAVWTFNNDSSIGESQTLFVDLLRKYNGTCSGSACPTLTTNAKQFNASSFDGGDVINLANDAFKNADVATHTLSMWIYTTDPMAAGGTMIDMEGYVRMFVTNNIVSAYNGNFGSNTYVISLNTWTHVAQTWNSTNCLNLYVNGNKVNSSCGGSAPTPDSTSRAVTIGAVFNNNNKFYGIIDEMRVYNRSLEDSEIQSLASLGSYSNYSVGDTILNNCTNYSSGNNLDLGDTNLFGRILGSITYRWQKLWVNEIDTKNITTTNINVTSNAIIYGDLNVSQNVIINGNVSFKRPYGMYSSTEDQTLALANTAYPVTFNYTEDDYEIIKQNNQNFTILQSGDYLIELSAIFQSSVANVRSEIWVQKWNGSWYNIPRSNTASNVRTANSDYVVSVPFIIDLIPTEKFRIMWAGDNTALFMNYMTNTSYSPETPSIIMTVSKISEITP